MTNSRFYNNLIKAYETLSNLQSQGIGNPDYNYYAKSIARSLNDAVGSISEALEVFEQVDVDYDFNSEVDEKLKRKTPAKKLLEKFGKKNEMALQPNQLQRGIKKVLIDNDLETGDDSTTQLMDDILHVLENNDFNSRQTKHDLKHVLDVASDKRIITQNQALAIFKGLSKTFNYRG